MEQLIIFSYKAKESRNNYLEEYNKLNKSTESKKTQNKVKKIKNNPLTDSEIKNFMIKHINNHNIKEVALNLPNNKNKQWNLNLFTIFNEKNKNNNISSLPITDQGVIFNCKKQFDDCIIELQKFDFKIYGIEMDINLYKNRMYDYDDSFNMKYIPFKFNCGKGYYRFDVYFYDTYTYYPGVFYINEITHEKTNQIIEIECDLYCGMTCIGQLREFLKLLNYDDQQTYVEKEVSHYIKISKSLQNAGFEVNDRFWIKPSDAHIIDEQPYIILSFNSVKYILSLNRLHDMEKLCFNKKDPKKSFYMIYNSSEKFSELCQCIIEYINYDNGLYGFLNETTKLFQNDYDFRKIFFTNHCTLTDIQVSYKFKTEYNKGRDFDIYINYVNSDNVDFVLPKSFIPAAEFICDFYGVNFWYDKYIDNNSCHVDIQGKYIDLTKFAEKYGDKTYDKNDDIILINNNLIEYSGSFDECILYMKKFFMDINILTNI